MSAIARRCEARDMAWRTVNDIDKELRAPGGAPPRARVKLLHELARELIPVDIERAASVSREAMDQVYACVSSATRAWTKSG